MNTPLLPKLQSTQTEIPHTPGLLISRINESPGSISHGNLPAAGHALEGVKGLTKDGKTKVLYESSRAREGHFEAADVLPAILKMQEHLGLIYGERISPERMVERFNQMQARADLVLNSESFVEGVHFFGSAMRGRVDCNDIDMFLVLRQPTVNGMLDRLGSWLEKRGLPEEYAAVAQIFLSLPLIAPIIFESGRALRISNRVVSSSLSAPIDGLDVDLQVRTNLFPDNFSPERSIFPPLMLSQVLTESGPYVCFTRGGSPKSMGVYFTEGDPAFYSKERSKQRTEFGPSEPMRF